MISAKDILLKIKRRCFKFKDKNIFWNNSGTFGNSVTQQFLS